MKKAILYFSIGLLVSSCYAQSMHLQDPSPWGPEQQGLQIQLESDTLPALLPLEHKLLESHFGESSATSDWVLALKLHRKMAPLQFPFIWGRAQTAERLRMEIEATGTLIYQGKPLQSYVWKAQGDTAPEKQEILATRLLERLNGQIYQELGPRYVYE